MSDAKCVHVEAGVIRAGIARDVVGDLKADTQLVDHVLIERVHPLGREIGDLGVDEDRNIRVDVVVLPVGTVPGKPPEDTVRVPEVVVNAQEVSAHISGLVDAFASREVERIQLAKFRSRYILFKDVQRSRMQARARDHVVRERIACVGIVDEQR